MPQLYIMLMHIKHAYQGQAQNDQSVANNYITHNLSDSLKYNGEVYYNF